MKIIRPEYSDDTSLIYSNVVEADYQTFDLTEIYSIGDEAIYVLSNVHWVIRSLTNGNSGNRPTGLNTDLNWVKVSETNRWKMFDQKTTSQTVNDDLIEFTLKSTGKVDSIALLNLDVNTIKIIVKDMNGVEIYTKSSNMVSTDGINNNYYNYFFNPIVRLTDIVLTDLPAYAFVTVNIRLISTSSTVKCGTALIGLQKDFGSTLYGMTIGLTDYSVKTADKWGDFTITERAFSKKMTLSNIMDNAIVDSSANLLNSYRATPIVWLGSDSFTSSFVYGFYKDYGISVAYTNMSIVNFEIEGLS